MNITRIEVVLSKRGERLLGFSTITLDGSFVIKDIRIIQGNGKIIIAMPDKQRATTCEHCDFKIRQRDNYCPRCGNKLSPIDVEYVDICHPIDSVCRAYIDTAILEQYKCVLTATHAMEKPLDIAATD